MLEYDTVHHVYDVEMIHKAAAQTIHYIMNEKDARGYVEGKGWAHAIAHGADALDGIAKHPHFHDTHRILRAIEVPLFNGQPYTDDEEERLAVPVLSLLLEKDAEDATIEWLTQIATRTNDLLKERKDSIHPYRVQHTVKNFMKSLYFDLHLKGVSVNVQQTILDSIRKWAHL